MPAAADFFAAAARVAGDAFSMTTVTSCGPARPSPGPPHTWPPRGAWRRTDPCISLHLSYSLASGSPMPAARRSPEAPPGAMSGSSRYPPGRPGTSRSSRPLARYPFCQDENLEPLGLFSWRYLALQIRYSVPSNLEHTSGIVKTKVRAAMTHPQSYASSHSLISLLGERYITVGKPHPFSIVFTCSANLGFHLTIVSMSSRSYLSVCIESPFF